MVEGKTGDMDLSDLRIYPFAKSLQVFFVDGRDKKGSVVDAMHPGGLPFLEAVVL